MKVLIRDVSVTFKGHGPGLRALDRVSLEVEASNTPRAARSDCWQRFTAPPALGRDTEKILSGLLGYPARRINALGKAGVTRPAPTRG